ncbi:MAG: ribonuclease HII [Candidatus Woesebacteria bacterium]|nr:MAG: ribonuclease HII [Candidatus Woesebacteria bacterium]
MDLPNFSFERGLWKQGHKLVAGMDEVGRGAFAGPVVTAAVIFEPTAIALSSRLRSQKDAIRSMVRINDSKKLTPKQRELASFWIKENCLAWAIGEASVSEINKNGIVDATNMAFRRAVKSLIRIDYLLIDAFYVPYVSGVSQKKQKAIIRGDSKSISIAASSIIAKVYRDKLMEEFSKSPPYLPYLWHKNKGYGTKEHRDAIAINGPTKLHRTLFLKLS